MSVYAKFKPIWRHLDFKAHYRHLHSSSTEPLQLKETLFDIIACLTSGKQSSGEEHTDVTPTGRVVGVSQRNWRDYVASFAENEVSFYLIHISF